MSVPTHYESCSSRAFPMTCRYCGEEVFYFFCTCGSKLFFNDLGHPWPIHQCFNNTTSGLIDDLIDVYGSINQTTLNHLKLYADEHQLEFDKKQLEIIEKYLKRGKKSLYRIEAQPADTSVAISGEISNINKNINFFKRFKMPQSVIATQLLGVLGKEKFNEIEVLVKDNYNNEMRNYRVLIPGLLSSTLSLRQKLKIAARIDIHEVPGKSKSWIINEIDII